ncbi:hypothetical protein NYR30_04470 [Gallibacterium salpingitidis]|uniref:hypothetical protein n=1 Tax=Gallibacterium salpingitidis TaxID=505341 RepID=UPI0026708342|nr:hypothetical protein [Gallibacterium salpingitidis]WKT00548.1 hypothetical protein NYR30_04470 [Gallibacterium salpingitidis]
MSAIKYLIIINKLTGKRETSLPLAPPVSSMNKLYQQAKELYPDENKYLYLEDDDGKIQAKLTNQDTYWFNGKVETRPSSLYDWDGVKWVLNEERQAELANARRQQFIDNIDNTASSLITKWTRFESEYKEREKAALDYQSRDYQGDASIYITSFADAANIDNKSAALLILQQATQLIDTLAKMSALRMRKYELKQDNLTLEQMQAIHDDVVSKMQALAETQK